MPRRALYAVRAEAREGLATHPLPLPEKGRGKKVLKRLAERLVRGCIHQPFQLGRIGER
jgi:hypothetical protein